MAAVLTTSWPFSLFSFLPPTLSSRLCPPPPAGSSSNAVHEGVASGVPHQTRLHLHGKSHPVPVKRPKSLKCSSKRCPACLSIDRSIYLHCSWRSRRLKQHFPKSGFLSSLPPIPIVLIISFPCRRTFRFRLITRGQRPSSVSTAACESSCRVESLCGLADTS